MKKMMVFMSVILIAAVLFWSSAFAYTYEEVEITDLIEPASSWAQEGIDTAKEEGLLTPGTSLFFKNDITRYDFAGLVVNMVEKVLGKELEPSGKVFTDTEDIAILKAYKAGIVSGTSKTTFSPDDLITREQIATMLYNSIVCIEKNKGKEYTTKKADISGSYSDKNKVSSWAKTGMAVLVNNGIMSGTSTTTLSPQSNATIEQSIILIYKLYDKIIK